MKIETITFPPKVYCATDSTMPRWKVFIAAVNKSNRVLTLDKVQASVSGNGSKSSTTLTGSDLESHLHQGGLTLKPKTLVLFDICDDGQVKKPASARVKMHFSSRNGAVTTIAEKFDLNKYKTVWLDVPLKGRWTAGNAREDLHCLGAQFGFDFIKQQDVELHDNPPQGRCTIDQCISFGEPIYAPTDGVVVSASNSNRDYRTVAKLSIGGKRVQLNKMVGNHIIIKTAQGLFILLAHLQKGSVNVQPDDTVAAGTQIAKMGNSGNTSAPHLHIEVLPQMPDLSQYNGSLTFLSGIPFGFKNVTRYRNNKPTQMCRCVPGKFDEIELLA